MLTRFKLHKLAVYLLILALLAVPVPLGNVASAAAQIYEAEAATLTGGAVTAADHTGYTGTGFVGGYTDNNKGNASIQFSVSASSSGNYTTLGLVLLLVPCPTHRSRTPPPGLPLRPN
jgi:hypothetical protein